MNKKRQIKIKLPKIHFSKILVYVSASVLVISVNFALYKLYQNNLELKKSLSSAEVQITDNLGALDKLKIELDELKSEDQYVKNEQLQDTIKKVEETYTAAVESYESLLKLKDKTKVDSQLDELYTQALVLLTNRDYEGAKNKLAQLAEQITKEEEKYVSSIVIPTNIVQSNAPPGSGYSRQSVNTDAGVFMVSMVAADVSSTRVIVDTASDGDCSNECPTLSLAEYVSRNGAYAGINGSYFCPATYPSCAGKTNSFDLLVMNHKKTYFNSGNNVYSSNPVVIFGDGYVRFVGSGSEWGRDTSPNGVLMNYPLLLFNGDVKFGGDDDPKKGSKGNRSFVANKGSSVYIGVVHSATVAESARVMKALGFENAINLDNGGSTALWSGGYKVGPGRSLPNVILFVSK